VGAARAQAAQATRTPAGDPDSLAVVALEHAWLTAQDSTTLARILAPDFQHPIPTGEVLTRAQHIHWRVTHPLPPGIQQRFASLAVRIYGTTAIANGMVVTSDSTGRELRRTLFSDVFVKRDGVWQAVNAQENAVPVGKTRPEERRNNAPRALAAFSATR
jgi:Domain of unknown function (DUF4440)